MPDSNWNWDIRIAEYLQADWSSRPTPFAQTVMHYLQPSSRILELGAGAGQDSIWFAQNGHSVVCSDQTDAAFGAISQRAEQANTSLEVKVVDMTDLGALANDSFDVVYAQLTIHYFNDKDTQHIYDELHRILNDGGVLAVMVNTVQDKEYAPNLIDTEGFIDINGLKKRYFSKETLAPFVSHFNALLFDEEGRTPKDDAKSNSGMVRFIGKKA